MRIKLVDADHWSFIISKTFNRFVAFVQASLANIKRFLSLVFPSSSVCVGLDGISGFGGNRTSAFACNRQSLLF
jgi:hypothetical protein